MTQNSIQDSTPKDTPKDTPRLIELDVIGLVPRLALAVDLSFTLANTQALYPSPHDWTRAIGLGMGYIAGMGDGLVTVNGAVARREILVADADAIYQGFSHRTFSLNNGHYLITDLDPSRKYLIMARDYKGEYEPVCYDNVAPASDLTADELGKLWQVMTQ